MTSIRVTLFLLIISTQILSVCRCLKNSIFRRRFKKNVLKCVNVPLKKGHLQMSTNFYAPLHTGHFSFLYTVSPVSSLLRLPLMQPRNQSQCAVLKDVSIPRIALRAQRGEGGGGCSAEPKESTSLCSTCDIKGVRLRSSTSQTAMFLNVAIRCARRLK